MSTTSKQSMKSKLALIFTGVTLAVSGATPALAQEYQSHEYPFYYSRRITQLSQEQGNRFCRIKFKQLRATGYFEREFANQVVRIQVEGY